VPDWLLIVLVALIVSVITGLVMEWDFNRRLYSVECDVADLQQKVLVEVKKRAVAGRWDRAAAEAELKAEMANRTRRFENPDDILSMKDQGL
jgi:predicted Holliday junction resolvase-like endonuclease